VVPGRQRNEKPVSSMKTMAACFRRAFFADPRPILLKPGPDHFLISLFGVNGRDLWAPTRSPEPSGQVIRMVRDTELAPDQITDPSQGPAIGLESGLEGALAEGLQDAVPLRGGQPGRSPRPGPAAKGSQPRGRMIAQLLGPLPNGPEADTQPSGDLGMSQATGSEQPSTLQPTFFNLALSKFARAPHHRNDAKTRAGEEATYLKLNSTLAYRKAGRKIFREFLLGAHPR
jgi:hypothetical protein